MYLFLFLIGLALPARGETLGEALDAAWGLSPEARSLEARRGGVEADARVARALLPEPPAVKLSARGDRFNEDRGEQEWEAELGLPLWLPGQRDARRVQADADGARLAAELAALRLELAGRLREAAWAVAGAEAELASARERLDTARGLEADVERRVRAGELARTDLLLARDETAAAESAVLEREAGLADALGVLETLRGRPATPSLDEPEPPAERTETHPREAAARLALEAAQAGLAVARADRSDAPELALFGRRERGDRDQPYSDSLGLSVRIPLGGEVRNAPRIAAAQTEADRARAELQGVLRELETDRATARRAYRLAQEQQRLAERRQEMATEGLGLARRSFEQGETGLPDLLRVRSGAIATGLLLAQGRVAAGLSRARLNQALGILP